MAAPSLPSPLNISDRCSRRRHATSSAQPLPIQSMGPTVWKRQRFPDMPTAQLHSCTAATRTRVTIPPRPGKTFLYANKDAADDAACKRGRHVFRAKHHVLHEPLPVGMHRASRFACPTDALYTNVWRVLREHFVGDFRRDAALFALPFKQNRPLIAYADKTCRAGGRIYRVGASGRRRHYAGMRKRILNVIGATSIIRCDNGTAAPWAATRLYSAGGRARTLRTPLLLFKHVLAERVLTSRLSLPNLTLDDSLSPLFLACQHRAA